LSVRHALQAGRFVEARATGGKPASARLVIIDYVDPAFCAMNGRSRFAADGGRLAVETFIPDGETSRL